MSKQVFNPLGKAEKLNLDPRSRFFKKRVKALKEVGYEVTKRTRQAVTLTLKDA